MIGETYIAQSAEAAAQDPVVLRLPHVKERTIIVCLNIFQHARPAADTQSLPNTLLA